MAASNYGLVRVKLTPRSHRDEISGWSEGVLGVRVKAPPVDGRANDRLRALLAEHLGVPARNITIVAGYAARIKTLRIEGLSEQEVRDRTEAAG